ncbi:MAG: hypothetical protein FJ279_22015, partial [Planctomycetes bacterium]|nr:hypothetical protein [Planctomycetota bacterium]
MVEAAEGGPSSAEFTVAFVAANASAPVGVERAETVLNYFVGDAGSWRTDVPTYEGVAYDELYEGIDLLLSGGQDHLKYEFHVAPGADYQQIQVAYAGIDALSLDAQGRLHIETPVGELLDDAPYVYQVLDGQQVPVEAAFELLDSTTYSFRLAGPYDPGLALVIDPELTWSTFLGGTLDDKGFDVDTDGAGNVYVTGFTESPDFPITGGGNPDFKGEADVFVSKFSPSGALLWSTFLGGEDRDEGQGLAADKDGNVFLTGYTRSSDFPVLAGWDTSHNGRIDAFVTRLSATGAIQWSTFLGGSADEGTFTSPLPALARLTADQSGNLYVAGFTESANFPAYSGWDIVHNGGADAYVAKFNSEGSLVWSTYLGGSFYDYAGDIVTDTGGKWVYLTGTTGSSSFPTPGGWDTSQNGGADAFVAKFNPRGALTWATFLGGTQWDWGWGNVTEESGEVYVTGYTWSTNFPVTTSGWDTTHNGESDAFVAKLNASGAVVWSTYLGGANVDSGFAIAMDARENRLYVTGETKSPDFPVDGAWDASPNGDSDAFLAQFNMRGALLASSFLGGSAADTGWGVATDGLSAYVAGSTSSPDFPTPDGWDTTQNGLADAFLAKFTENQVTLGKDGVPSVEYRDADNDLFRLTYTGPGSAEVTFNAPNPTGADINSVTFANATTNTKLESRLLRDDGDGATTLDAVNAPGQSLGTLDLAATSILGDVTLGTFNPGGIVGGRIGSLILGGDLGPDGPVPSAVTVAAITRLQIGGDLQTVLKAAQGIGSITVTGDIAEASQIYSGLGLDLQPNTPDDELKTSRATLGATEASAVDGIIWSSTNISRVRSKVGSIGAVITALLDLKSVLSAADITADASLNAGRDVSAVTAAGKLSANITAGRNIPAVTAGSMDPALVAQTGKIGTVRTTLGDLQADLTAAKGVTSVKSAGNFIGSVTSNLAVGTVYAKGSITAVITARGGNVSTVEAVGQFQGEVRATGSISKVKAGTVSDSVIQAGSGGALNADVSTVYAGAGGILN